MDLLVIDLKNTEVERIPSPSSLEGLEEGISLHRKYGKESLVITSPSSVSMETSSINCWTVVWDSPLLGHETFALFNTYHGYSLYRLGIKAMVILGRSDRMKYIALSSASIEILPSENLRGTESLYFEEIALSSHSDLSLSTGPAGDSGVKFASVQSGGKNMPGIDLGHIFFLHNLKGIVFPGFPDRKAGEGNIPQRNAEKGEYFKSIRSYGGYSFVSKASSLGWLPVRGWQDRTDPRSGSIDGCAMAERYGNYPESCSDCILACDRRRKDGHILPKWREMMTLGTNLGFFDPDNIDSIVSEVRKYGLDASVTGSMLAYILSDEERMAEYGLKDRSVPEIVALISRIASGCILYNGLSDLPGCIQCQDHLPIDFDLRGASAMALSYSSLLGFFLPSTLLFPKRRPKEDAAATIAFYEVIHYLALSSLGHPPMCSDLGYWSKVPEAAFQSRLLARFYSRRFHAFGHSSLELLEKGMEIYRILGVEWTPLPSHFLLDSDSAGGSDTVPLKRLQDYWDEEKLRLEIMLRSRREKRVKHSAERSAKDGGSEVLG